MSGKKKKRNRSRHGRKKHPLAANAQPVVTSETQPTGQPDERNSDNWTPAMTDKSWFGGWEWDKKLRIFDGLLTLVSFFGLFILFYQSGELNRTNNLAMSAQRAWVGPVRTGEQLRYAVDAPLFVQVVVQNTGLSPARHLRGRAATRLHPTNDPFVADYRERSISSGVGILMPQAELTYTLSGIVNVTSAEISSVRNGERTLYLFGEVDYLDIFDQPRRTTYCMRLRRDLAGFVACNTYNDAS